MTDLFDKYGDRRIRARKRFSDDISESDYFTLNELAEALEEKLYPKFKERYDREKNDVFGYTEDGLDEASGD